MRDIKKRSTNLRSNTQNHSRHLDDLRSPKGGSVHAEIPLKRHTVDIDRKFENFERSLPSEHKIRKEIKKVPQSQTSKNINKILYLLIALAIIVILLMTFIFNRATITLTPRVEPFDTKDNLVISNNLQKNFEVIEITKTASKQIPKSELKTVATKSSGTITIYNNYSESAQKLIKNTRFETKDGKIFRITESVTIPGKVGATPGFVVANVFADAIGSTYNIAPTTFTIPGFKNTARYSGFYAESKDYMKGGSSGNVEVVATEDIDITKADLEAKLKQELEQELKNINKDGFIGIFSNIEYVATDNKSNMLVTGEQNYNINIVGKALFVRKDAISSASADKNIKGYNGEDVRIGDFNNIKISLSEGATLLSTSSVSILVEGKDKIVYEIDQEEFKKELAGKSKTEFPEIMKSYKVEIYSAKSKISPVWIQDFPSNLKKIKIEESLQ